MNYEKSGRKFDSAFKARVAIEALKERETLSELVVEFDLHPTRISQWEQEFLENSSIVFENKAGEKENEVDVAGLYHKIGEMEKDFLKKVCADWGYPRQAVAVDCQQ